MSILPARSSTLRIKQHVMVPMLGLAAMTIGAAPAQANYQDVIQASNPAFYYTWDDAEPIYSEDEPDLLLNHGYADGGDAVGGGQHAVAPSTTNAGGLSLGNAGSFGGTIEQAWWTGFTGGSAPNDGTYSSYAMEFWIYFDGEQSPTYIFQSAPNGWNGQNAPSVINGYEGNGLEIFTNDGRTGASFPTLASNAWNHVVMGYEAIDGATNRQTLILNGDYANATSVALIDDHEDFPNFSADVMFAIGDEVFNKGLFQGMLDEFAIYDLSDEASVDARLEEFAGHYSATSTVIPTPAALPAGLLLLGAIAMRRRPQNGLFV
ncbi:MAG: LamG-like jellyroll fold domain-containing protein [Phycisphaeraceae bacterium]